MGLSGFGMRETVGDHLMLVSDRKYSPGEIDSGMHTYAERGKYSKKANLFEASQNEFHDPSSLGKTRYNGDRSDLEG